MPLVVCKHCQYLGPDMGDHTCPCPYSDEDCTRHPKPIAVLKTYSYEGSWYAKNVYVWCPGCSDIHPFRVELNPESPTYSQRKNQEVWGFDGNLDAPTFTSSLLVYNNVCVCPPEYKHYEICELGDDCEAVGHAVLHADGRSVKLGDGRERNPETELLGHNLGHSVPAGNCHSYVRNGMWEFLSDSAHRLAGQTVPLPPLPDWWFGDDEDE